MGLADQIRDFQQPLAHYDESGRRREPTNAELRDGYTAPGTDPDYPVALLYMADHETLGDGLCRQARTHARALADAGCPLRLQTIQNRVRHGDEYYQPAGEDFLDPGVLAQVRDLRRKSIGYAGIVLHQTTLGSAAALDYMLVPHHMRSHAAAVESLLARTIVYAPYEADRLPDEVASLLWRCGQVWVQCNANLRAFLRSGVPESRIWVVPNAYDDSAPALAVRGTPVPLGKRFYHIGKWEPRKNQHQMIGAFLTAYGPRDAASLFVKTSAFGDWPGYPAGPGESIALWLQSRSVQARGWTEETVRKRVIVHTRQFSEEEIGNVHRVNNIYVTASHAEGWDYPAFDAALAGNAIVHVGNGGSEDYWKPEWGESIPFEIGFVDPGYVDRIGWHPDSRWANPAFNDIVAALQRAKPPGSRQARPELDRYHAGNIGKLMLRLVEQLASERCPALREALP